MKTYCTAPDCTNFIRGRGNIWCNTHYRLLKLAFRDEPCAAIDCNKQRINSGTWCPDHKNQIKRAFFTSGICQIVNCESSVSGRGCCQHHYNLLYRYEIDVETLNRFELIKHCESCGEEIDSRHIDHCHLTGAIRGLLCSWCNQAEGLLQTSKRARKLADYMEKWGR